jgi:DNA helicase IV
MFGHVIVDEAQDLTPMQLRMVARRARDGALTILGDVAQATGPIAYTSWQQVLDRLPGGDRADVEELRHAYRVPREIMELALPLLDTIAPDVEPPISYRTGAAPPRLQRVEGAELLAAACRLAARARAGGRPARGDRTGNCWTGLRPTTSGTVCRCCPRGRRRDSSSTTSSWSRPARLAAQEQGLRELYVALTRPTKTLVVVYARPLPQELRRS